MTRLIIHAALILLAFGFSAAVQAHEWYTGQKNEQGQGCCGGQDCSPFEPNNVRMVTPTHWQITINPGELGTYGPDEAVPIVLDFHGNPGLSPDGQYHACATRADISYLRRVRCLFVGGLF